MMLVRDLFRLSLHNLLLHKVRSILTSLGVIFGVGSVIAMLAVSEGAKILADEAACVDVEKFPSEGFEKPGNTEDTRVDCSRPVSFILLFSSSSLPAWAAYSHWSWRR